jgi:hypothetical protein
MPVWLRLFTYNLLKEHFDKQREEAEKQQNMLKNKSGKDIKKPDIAPTKQPTYTVKAPKK